MKVLLTDSCIFLVGPIKSRNNPWKCLCLEFLQKLNKISMAIVQSMCTVSKLASQRIQRHFGMQNMCKPKNCLGSPPQLIIACEITGIVLPSWSSWAYPTCVATTNTETYTQCLSVFPAKTRPPPPSLSLGFFFPKKIGDYSPLLGNSKASSLPPFLCFCLIME